MATILASLPTGSNRFRGDGASSPYGDSYAETGATDHKFAGQDQDLVPSGPYPLSVGGRICDMML